MKYTFKDVLLPEIYETANVIFTAGQYTLFNNMVADRIREECKPKVDIFGDTDTTLLSEWGIQGSKDGEPKKLSITNIVDFDTFMGVVEMPSLNGRWYCSVGLDSLKKKQKEQLMNYIKAPSPNGALVVFTMEWKEYKDLLWNKAIQLSKSVHIIQLSFPNRTVLTSLVTNIFKSKGLHINESAASLFVMRMSSAYDEYEEIIDGIALERPDSTLSEADMQECLKGIDNYILDDLITEMLKPMGSDKVRSQRYVYKMLTSLLSSMTAQELVTKLKYKVADYIEFRVAINEGIIPIKIKYYFNDVIRHFPEDNKLAKMSEYTFRKMANTASLTSLRDWIYIQLMLNNASRSWDVQQQEIALFSMIHRSTLNRHRILNDIGVINTLDESISIVNRARFTEEKLQPLTEYSVTSDDTEVDTEVIVNAATGELI